MIYCLVNIMCVVGLQLIKANKCKLVNVYCKHGLLSGDCGNWLVVQTFAMVLEIIGRNNYYQLHVRQGELLDRLRQYAT